MRPGFIYPALRDTTTTGKPERNAEVQLETGKIERVGMVRAEGRVDKGDE